MKLLVVSYWFPYPPINGARMRTYNLFKRLGQRHELHLATFYQEDEDLKYTDHLREFCSEVYTVKAKQFVPSMRTAAAGLLSLKPRSSVECYSREMVGVIRDALKRERFDAALAFTLRSADYIANLPELPKVLDDDNIEAAYMRRCMEQQAGRFSKFRHTMTWMKARAYERSTAARFDAVTVVSEDDREEIAKVSRELAEAGAVHVVPNGVDLGLLDYQPPARDLTKLVYNGALSYFANMDAVRFFAYDILPLIRQKVSDVKLLVTGSTKGVDISEFADMEGIEFTGFVPDIRPVVAGAGAVVVSARFGGGTRLKILEAMALGTPVVATTLGGMGFGAVDGRHLLIADEPQKFAEAVVKVLQDRQLANELASNARDFVKLHYGWDNIAGKLEEVVGFAVERKGRAKCLGTVTS